MRLRSLKNTLSRDDRYPFLISSLPNIDYLTGFKGSYAYILVDTKKSYFISDSRYREYATGIIPRKMEFRLQEGDIIKTLKALLGETGHRRLFLEEHSLFLSTYFIIKKRLRGIRVTGGGDPVNSLRAVKDEGELRLLKKAAEITDLCMNHLTRFIRPGITEWDVSNEIETFYRTRGCRRSSFNVIVASGRGSSMPHYVTSMKKKIRMGDAVLIDMGCHYEGYNSDLTRTVFVGSIDEKMRGIYEIVRMAQESAVAAVRPGITAGKLDSIAREIIKEHGHGDDFGHGLGHGLGLDVHEPPAIKPESDVILKKNMVITIEPGIYITDYGGVRIEDMVRVTGRGHEVLTRFPKDIIVL